ncbi:MAG: 16S rRNA methyltransferase, partial [Candidatus Promineifilaceae bacterium]
MSLDSDLEKVVAAVKESRKYHETSEETIRLLAEEALRQHKRPKAAIKAVRKRLHSIMAPYLGDPDYAAATAALDQACLSGDESAVRQVCLAALESHLSTRERLPIMRAFYEQIFAVTGRPSRLLDLACGLNPLALPW